MTPSQRQLAEYVARWAGWERIPINGTNRWLNCVKIADEPFRLLTDPALAWQAQEELIELVGETDATSMVLSQRADHGCTRIEATFRALRAARGGE